MEAFEGAPPATASPALASNPPGLIRRGAAALLLVTGLLAVGGVAAVHAATPDPSASPAATEGTTDGGTTGGTTDGTTDGTSTGENCPERDSTNSAEPSAAATDAAI